MAVWGAARLLAAGTAPHAGIDMGLTALAGPFPAATFFRAASTWSQRWITAAATSRRWCPSRLSTKSRRCARWGSQDRTLCCRKGWLPGRPGVGVKHLIFTLVKLPHLLGSPPAPPMLHRSWRASCPRRCPVVRLRPTRSCWSTTLYLRASGPLAAAFWLTRSPTTAFNSAAGGRASTRPSRSLLR